jgi:putative membrane protein
MMWGLAPWWHWLGMVAFWVLLVVVAVWAVGRLFPPTPQTHTSAARATLDERLARGEVDLEQYRRLRELIEH